MTETINRADAEIERFIERRSQTDADREREEMYAASVARHNARLQAERRAEWADYHEGQAQRLESTAATLAADHRATAARLRAEAS